MSNTIIRFAVCWIENDASLGRTLLSPLSLSCTHEGHFDLTWHPSRAFFGQGTKRTLDWRGNGPWLYKADRICSTILTSVQTWCKQWSVWDWLPCLWGFSVPAIVPVVTPMWCPVPMAMYAKPYPVPVPIPIPIPVPIFIPTSRNTARGVEKCIKKIRYIQLLVVSGDHD